MASLLAALTILHAAAWLLTAALRTSSAALRHAVWTCAIAATLLYAPLHWGAPRRVIQQPVPQVFRPAVVLPIPAGALRPSADSPGATPLDFSAAALALWAL